MAETKRYRLPAELGGGEVVRYGTNGGGYLTVGVQPGGPQIEIHENWLTELPPPIPDEPEPGAYELNDGGSWAVRFRHIGDEPRRWLMVGSSEWMTWAQVVEEADGGPDVRIVALVPKYDPSEPLAQWEQHLLDKQAEVVEAEREVIEAAKAWHARVRQQKPGHESARHFTEGNLLRALDWLTTREADHA